eukprot:3577752-Prymnesium_polylepis.1
MASGACISCARSDGRRSRTRETRRTCLEPSRPSRRVGSLAARCPSTTRGHTLLQQSQQKMLGVQGQPTEPRSLPPKGRRGWQRRQRRSCARQSGSRGSGA